MHEVREGLLAVDGDDRNALAIGALEVGVVNPLSPDRAVRGTGGGHGMIGMRERAALLGGTLEAGARNGRFELRAHLPAADGAA